MADATEVTGSFSDALVGGEYFFLQGMTDGPVYFESGDEFGDEIHRDPDTGKLVGNTGAAHYRMEIGYLTVFAGLDGAGVVSPQGAGGAVIQRIKGVQMNGNQTIAEYERFKYPATMGGDPSGDYSIWSEWIKIG